MQEQRELLDKLCRRKVRPTAPQLLHSGNADGPTRFMAMPSNFLQEWRAWMRRTSSVCRPETIRFRDVREKCQVVFSFARPPFFARPFFSTHSSNNHSPRPWYAKSMTFSYLTCDTIWMIQDALHPPRRWQLLRTKRRPFNGGRRRKGRGVSVDRI